MTDTKDTRVSVKFLKELVGFVGVVGSLIFVGLQIRQNTMAARATAYQQMGTLLSDIWLQTAADPDRALLTMRFFLEDSAKFTPAEEAVLINQSVAAMRQYEATWRQVQLGLLKPDVLNAFGWNTEGLAPSSTNMKKLWPRLGQFMSPDFRSVLETQLGLK